MRVCLPMGTCISQVKSRYAKILVVLINKYDGKRLVIQFYFIYLSLSIFNYFVMLIDKKYRLSFIPVIKNYLSYVRY